MRHKKASKHVSEHKPPGRNGKEHKQVERRGTTASRGPGGGGSGQAAGAQAAAVRAAGAQATGARAAAAQAAAVREAAAMEVAARAAAARAASRYQFAASATNISSSKHISSWKLAAHTVPCSFTRERRTHEKRACRIDGARRGVGGARNCRVLRARKMQVCVEPLCVCCALEMCQLGATGCS